MVEGCHGSCHDPDRRDSCHDMWHQDYSDCPNGVYVKFKYDYNLQRADMFNDHVGQVTLYVFDENGNYITQQTETNSALSSPLKDPNYVMHVENLQPGKYQFLALAGQNAYADQLTSGRAKFVRTAPSATGDKMQKLEVNLDHEIGESMMRLSTTAFLSIPSGMVNCWRQ